MTMAINSQHEGLGLFKAKSTGGLGSAAGKAGSKLCQAFEACDE